MKNITLISFFTFISFVLSAQVVSNPVELQKAIKAAKPGTEITMANGIWNDVEILFESEGTPQKPITLKAQEKGEVTITGNSNIRIAGKHLVVEGLVFKDGESPTSELISFKKDNESLASNCRVTEVVIDNFNGSERYDTQAWVVLYGKNNRVDHCSFLNKRVKGVTLIVRLNSPESRENNHQIDHNYFGPRQSLGSNGGETLRIGTSHYCMENSMSTVEYNYFDRCSGEVEIISNKSGKNTYRGNTFYECQGTLTMRHGNETLVEGNVFLGNGVAHTGGIRVINEKQTVQNNYMEGLTGDRFRGALTIMNGVPNSPLNRYVPVKDSKIINNTLINCEHVELCAGSDSERSSAPSNTKVDKNIFYADSPNLFGVYDDISGLSFDQNCISKTTLAPFESGFTSKRLKFKRAENGLLVTGSKKTDIGANIGLFASNTNTGAQWYTNNIEEVDFGTGGVTTVQPGLNTLYDAILQSNPGDILVLAGGPFTTSKSIKISHPLSIVSSQKAKLLFETKSLFTIENGGSLKLEGLLIDGSEAPDGPLNSVISTSRYSMNQNYKLLVNNCDFVDLDVNNSFNVLSVAMSTFADTISFSNSSFQSVSGDVLALNRETDDIGIYNAESVLIENCSFKDVQGSAVNLYRGGSDESTTAGLLLVDHCDFNNVGFGKKNKSKASLSIWGIQNVVIKNSIFNRTAPMNFTLTVGEPTNSIHHCHTDNDQVINIEGETFKSSSLTHQDPLRTLGDDNKTIGLLK